MTSFKFTYTLGSAVELCDCPRTRDSLGTDNLLWVLLQSSGLQADSTLNNYASLATLLGGGNLECAATAYARKVLGRSDFTVATNTTTRVRTVVAAANPVIWTSLGGILNNTMAKILLCYRGASSDADSAIRPLYCYDASGITSGQDFKVAVPAILGQAA